MTLTIHHLQTSQSERIPWLCEELEIPYTLKLYKRNPLLSPPNLKALTPLGTAPVLTDTHAPYSESAPLTMAESAAIIEYLVHRYGQGRLMLPPSHSDYATFLYWWHFSNGTLQPAHSRAMTLQSLHAAPDNPSRIASDARRRNILAMMDEQLGRGPWLAGEEFSVADIMAVFSVTTMREFFGFSLDGYEGILAWLGRVAKRPAYQRAMGKSDPERRDSLGAESPPLFGPILKRMSGESK